MAYPNVPYINSLLPSLDNVMREVKVIRKDIDKSIAQTPGLARKVLALTSGVRENFLRLNADEKILRTAVSDIADETAYQRLTFVGQYHGNYGTYLRFKSGAGDIFEFFADPYMGPGRFGYVRSVRGYDINAVDLYKYVTYDGNFSGWSLSIDGTLYGCQPVTIDGGTVAVWDIPAGITCKSVTVCARHTLGRYVMMSVDGYGYHITEVTGSTPATAPTIAGGLLDARFEAAGMQLVEHHTTGKTAVLTYDGDWVKDKPFRMDIRY